MEPTYYYKQGLSFIKATEESLHLINKENESLKTENARFRDALELLAKDTSGTCCECLEIKDIAREALNGKE